MNETDFETEVLNGVRGIGAKVDRLDADYDQLSRQTKSAFEDLTRLKNSANDHHAILQSLKRANTMMRMENRSAFADPLQRIRQDEELRTRVNVAIRMAINSNGDMDRVVAPMRKALGEDSSPGSTLINTALANEIYDLLSVYGQWSTLGVRRMGTKLTKLPVKTGRPVANVILTEGGQISDDTNKAGTTVDLEVEAIGVLLNVAIQLLQDSEFDVTMDVLDDFAQAIAERLDWLAFRADGDADGTDGGMTGVFEFGTAAPAASGNTTVETLDLDDVLKCLTTVAPRVLSRPARWWLHPQMLVRFLAIKDGNGRPIFLTATEAPSFGALGTILGYPVTLTFAAPSANEASAKVAAFGDPNGYVVGLRQDFMFEASDHHRWDHLQRSFRGVARAGTKGRISTALSILTLASS